MSRFILKRFLIMPPMLLIITFFLFLVINISPTDPATALLPSEYTQADKDAIYAEYGFDQPLVVQYGLWLGKAVQGDMGVSYQTKVSIWDEAVTVRLPISAKIAVVALIVSMVLGIPLGVISAVNQYSKIDLGINLTAKTLGGIPGFLYAIIFSLIFCIWLGWLPSYGLSTPLHWILPIASGAVGSIGGTCRQTRTSMLECIRRDYITTARSKGIPERTVIFSEALRNALLPIITMTGGQLSAQIGGNIIIESMFAVPGLGSYVVTAIQFKDTPVIMGTTTILSIFFMIIMLCVDLAYGIADPRTRATFLKGSKVKAKKPAAMKGASA